MKQDLQKQLQKKQLEQAQEDKARNLLLRHSHDDLGRYDSFPFNDNVYDCFITCTDDEEVDCKMIFASNFSRRSCYVVSNLENYLSSLSLRMRKRRKVRRNHPVLAFAILLLTIISSVSELYYFMLVAEASMDSSTSNVYEYNICNGLSNQLLYHASSIAIAIEQKKQFVFVPDHYIIHGVQMTDADVLPMMNNSVPFGYVFDENHFVAVIDELSAGQTEVIFLNMDIDDNHGIYNGNDSSKQQRMTCSGMNAVSRADPRIMLTLLNNAFQPSPIFRNIIEQIQLQLQMTVARNIRKQSRLFHAQTKQQVVSSIDSKNNEQKESKGNHDDDVEKEESMDDDNFDDFDDHELNTIMSSGICIHHRDGLDWHEHCKRWSSINDGTYRGNCLNVPNETFIESLQYRGLNVVSIGSTDNSTSTSLVSSGTAEITLSQQFQHQDNVEDASWVYYCGDHKPPEELIRAVGGSVYTRTDKRFKYLTRIAKHPKLFSATHSRDIAALIDFFVCKSIPSFIGNSVSTFSALQIAMRKSTDAYWYNSQSIPIAAMFPTYMIPIVYTYTELSKESGKYLLKASITSVRKHMPHNPIYILYDGSSDTAFLSWLRLLDVIIIDHALTANAWRDSIEQMRRNGNSGSSNLFLHPGNYFGTWQRIDIPLFVRSEYCLLLDADTIVRRPFTLSDFGLNLTRSIALSAEVDRKDERPWNAGVMLMNIPHLRKTHDSFLSYILEHVPNATFNHPSPSDQGAYLAYYKDSVQFLDTKFNFKPYWLTSIEEYNASFIIHYHGAKPHEYILHAIGERCDDAISFLCEKGSQMLYLCPTLQEFATSVNQIDYCSSSFPDDYEKEMLCVKIFETIAGPDGCYAFETFILGIDRPNVLSNHQKQSKPIRVKKRIWFNSLFRFIEDYPTRRRVRITAFWMIMLLVCYVLKVLVSQKMMLRTTRRNLRPKQYSYWDKNNSVRRY